MNGKNTVANIIQYLTSYNLSQRELVSFQKFKECLSIDSYQRYFEESNSLWKQRAFATKLKMVAELLTGMPYESFENEEVKNTLMDPKWDKKDVINGVTVEESYTYRRFLQLLGTEVGRSIHPRTWEYALFADYKPLMSASMVAIDLSSLTKLPEEIVPLQAIAYPQWIITDVRFPNEAEAIKSRNGLLIRVFRPGKIRVWYNDNSNSHEEDNSGYYYIQDIHDGSYYLSFKPDEMTSILASKDQITFDSSDNHPSETSLDLYEFDEVIINDGDIDSLIEKVRKVLNKHKIVNYE